MESSSPSTTNRLTASVSGKSCPICLRHVDSHQSAVISACMHAYCHSCLLQWTSYKRRCPLCNADFNSFFSNLHQISSRTFRKHHLPPSRTFSSGDESLHNRRRLALQREIRRTRRDSVIGLSSSSRSRPLPRRRSFGWGEDVSSDVVQNRIIQWRYSIYEQRLRAVPLASRSFLQQNGLLDGAQKERVIQRIEAWIRRELQTILNDPDPTIIVHVATSLFVSAIEKSKVELPDSQDDLLAPLRRFLNGWTHMFWHELRCFAESGITMDTYDTVVEYKPSD